MGLRDFKVSTNSVFCNLISSVDELIIKRESSWNVLLIDLLFSISEACAIVSIHPYGWYFHSKQSWLFNLAFSVHVALNHIPERPPLSPRIQASWKVFGKPKIVHFLWKVIQNAIALLLLCALSVLLRLTNILFWCVL